MSHPIRVLIVDDDAPFRLAARMSLQRKGFEAEACESGEEAIQKIQNGSYDVMVLDYWMPEMTGLNVLQWMHEQKDETPVLMLTGAGSEQIVVEAMKLGAYDYLRKDHVELDHLAVLVAGIHERHLFRRERTVREQIERDRESMRSSAEMLEKAVSSLTHIINNELTLVNFHVSEVRQMATADGIDAAHRDQLQRLSSDLQQGFTSLSSAVRSMLSLSTALQSKLTPGSDPAQVEAFLLSIKALQDEHARTMGDSSS